MLKDISNALESTIPMTNLACYAAGVFIGRKFCLAASFKIAGIFSTILGKQNIAEKWNNVSSQYWTLAKKDAIRDLTAVAGLIAWALLANYATQALTKYNNEKEIEKDNETNNKKNIEKNIENNKEAKKIEPSLSEGYTILNTLWEYPKMTLAAITFTAASLGIIGIGWKFRGRLFSSCRHEMYEQRKLLRGQLELSKVSSLNPFNIIDKTETDNLINKINSITRRINLIDPDLSFYEMVAGFFISKQ